MTGSRTRTPRLSKGVVAAGILVVAAAVIIGVFTVGRQRDALYEEKVRTGRILARQFAESAAVPLLADDMLTLDLLVRQASRLDGTRYAAIADGRGVIRAHSDPSRTGAALADDRKPAAGGGLLDLAHPITYRGKTIGSFRLGLSLDALLARVRQETRVPVYGVAALGFLVVATAVGMPFLLDPRRDRRPVDRASVAGEGGSRDSADANRDARNQVTVLCAGVKGFKEYSVGRHPETLVESLNEYFDIASRCIHGYGGHVDKFEGDTIIAVFDSPSFQSDHSKRAIRAAVSMMKELQEAWTQGNEILGMVGIGVSTGVVLSGLVRSAESRGPFFIGESFRAAQRLAATARPGEILIGKDVYQSVERLVSVEPLPPTEAMDPTGPWENFRLVRIEERRTRA